MLNLITEDVTYMKTLKKIGKNRREIIELIYHKDGAVDKLYLSN